MSARFDLITIDTADTECLATFWCAALGLHVSQREDDDRWIVLSTADGGTTWVTRYRGTRHAELGWKVTFSSARVGYVSIQPFHDGARYFLKTTDGGNTWHDKVFTTDDYDAQGIGFVTDTHGWIGGRGTGTYETYDGGETWHTNPSVGTNVNRFRLTRDGVVYAIGETVSRY